MDVYSRGLNNFLYYFVGSLLQLWYNNTRSPVLIIKAPALWLAEDYSNGVAGLTDVLVAYKQDASKLHPECGESDKVTVEVRNYFPPIRKP